MRRRCPRWRERGRGRRFLLTVLMTLTNTRKNPNIGERGGTTMIIELIKRKVPPGTTIPKPQSKKVYLVIGWKNNRQGEDVLEYSIPTKSGTGKRSRKTIPSSVFEAAHETLCSKGQITKDWFANTFPKVDASGGCNFTTLGGIFEILKLVKRTSRGVYRRSSL